MCPRALRLCWMLQRAIPIPVSSTEQPEHTKAKPGGEEMSLTSYMPPATTGKKYLSSTNFLAILVITLQSQVSSSSG